MGTTINASNRKDLSYYCDRFATLNVSKTQERGKAVHKPILILSVIELIAQDESIKNRFFPSNDLIEIFKRYWSILAANSIYTDAIHYPFIHLQGEGFWHVKFNDVYTGKRIKTTNKLKEQVEYAYLDDELYSFMQDAIARQVLVDSLVSTWFADRQPDLDSLLEIDNKFDPQQSELPNLDSQPKITLRRSIGRNSFFRKSVVCAYDYRCAFCKLRITRNPNQNIVDGAHIKPFSEFLDSRIDNGLSLCKNHHWAFDLGWFSIDDNYRILVASDLDDDLPHTRSMQKFDGEQIVLPTNKRLFPRLESLQWHREYIFKP